MKVHRTAGLLAVDGHAASVLGSVKVKVTLKSSADSVQLQAAIAGIVAAVPAFIAQTVVTGITLRREVVAKVVDAALVLAGAQSGALFDWGADDLWTALALSVLAIAVGLQGRPRVEAL